MQEQKWLLHQLRHLRYVRCIAYVALDKNSNALVESHHDVSDDVFD